MTKYHIVGHFDQKEGILNSDFKNYINFLDSRGKLRFNVNDSLINLKKMGIYPTETAIDLVLLAILIQTADKKLNRYDISEDAWTREIKITLPVADVSKWNNSKECIKKMLEFLTGDFWDFEFIQRNQKYKSLNKGNIPSLFTGNKISLFSGGLDSLIGMIDFIETDKNPIFVSFGGEAKTSKSQDTLISAISFHDKYKNIKNNRLRFNFNAHNIFPDIKDENTTRARSFLFFAIGVFVGSGITESFELFVPENGFIALNIPLEITRLGAYTTRTTHPYYMSLWNKLLNLLSFDGNITNPYWNKTKGEMIKDVKNYKLLNEVIEHSISCSSPASIRWRKKPNISHCGYCLPCIIRQSAIISAYGKDMTLYLKNIQNNSTLSSNKKEGEHVRGFQYAINRLKNNPGIERKIIHLQGPLSQDFDKIEDYIGVYKRGIAEVENLLKNTKTI